MKKTKLVIIALLCVGLASAADARQKGHRRHAKHGKAKHHTAAKTKPTRPARPAAAPPAAPAPAEHHTIAPNVISINSPGVWTYGANLTSGQVNVGDGFTIFDFGGYVDGSIFAPTGWTATPQLLGSVLTAPPPVGYVDDPAAINLLFTWQGPAIIGPQKVGPPIALGEFGATTTFTSETMIAWSSRDHTFATPGHPSVPGELHADSILGPAPGPTSVPDGGATVALFGIGLTGLEAMRRMLRARKA
jgi:hypothetical protein